jgi:hypothetical protein
VFFGLIADGNVATWRWAATVSLTSLVFRISLSGAKLQVVTRSRKKISAKPKIVFQTREIRIWHLTSCRLGNPSLIAVYFRSLKRIYYFGNTNQNDGAQWFESKRRTKKG